MFISKFQSAFYCLSIKAHVLPDYTSNIAKPPEENLCPLIATTSTLISSQVGLATAKTILGHADLKTTLRYTPPEIEEQRRGVAKIEQLYFNIISNQFIYNKLKRKA